MGAGLLAAAVLAGCVAVPLPERASGPGGGSSAPPSAAQPPASLAAVEAEIHALINQHRTSRGMPPLAYDERVAEIARRHSRAMASGQVRFGHDGFDTRGDEIGRLYPIRSMAENVAYDSRPNVAVRLVEGWVQSSGHRANIEGAFGVTGVGVARAADGTVFATQLFISRR